MGSSWTALLNGGMKMDNLEEEATYVDGKLVGINRSWYNNGELRVLPTMTNDELEGLARNWHENGEIKSEEKYVDGKGWKGSTDLGTPMVSWTLRVNIDMARLEESLPNMALQRQVKVRRGIFGRNSMDCTRFGMKWATRRKREPLNGEMDGVGYWWHENGVMAAEINFVKGLKEGAATWWWVRSGQIKDGSIYNFGQFGLREVLGSRRSRDELQRSV